MSHVFSQNVMSEGRLRNVLGNGQRHHWARVGCLASLVGVSCASVSHQENREFGEESRQGQLEVSWRWGTGTYLRPPPLFLGKHRLSLLTGPPPAASPAPLIALQESAVLLWATLWIQ